MGTLNELSRGAGEDAGAYECVSRRGLITALAAPLAVLAITLCSSGTGASAAVSYPDQAKREAQLGKTVLSCDGEVAQQMAQGAYRHMLMRHSGGWAYDFFKDATFSLRDIRMVNDNPSAHSVTCVAKLHTDVSFLTSWRLPSPPVWQQDDLMSYTLAVTIDGRFYGQLGKGGESEDMHLPAGL